LAYRIKEETLIKRQEKVREIRDKYALISPHLNERGKRLFAGMEAASLGYKGVSLVSEATGLNRGTVKIGRDEIISGETLDNVKVRKDGAGRKTVLEKYPEIQNTLIQIVDSTTFGNPEKPLQWTCKSQRTLADELTTQGFKVSSVTVGVILDYLGYSTQSNKKSLEGSDHIDRNAQFEFINNKVISFQNEGLPVISVDTKKERKRG